MIDDSAAQAQPLEACEGDLCDAFDAVAYINTPRWQASRLGLERITELLDRMGRPQDALKFVHVAGTNGKGSTCSYIASALTAAGYKTGLFTSPYVEVFEERIRVDGVNVSPGDLTRATLAVREHAQAMERERGEHPTEFELMTAVAFEHFRRAGCDIVVLEVGLGGRLDSTNVIDAPEVSVICRIGLDHTALLGDTLAAVAREKAGIVKAGAPVVCWPQEPDALEAVKQAARACASKLHLADFSRLRIEPLDRARRMRAFSYAGCRFETQLLGSYQPENAAVAIEALRVLADRGWRISEQSVREGIARATWPGRFEVVGADPLVIVDGGHNPQGALALADSLVDLLGGYEASARAVDFVMGVLADKDYRPMIRAVLGQARSFTTYTPQNPRALAAEDLACAIEQERDAAGISPDACRIAVASTPALAMARARQSAQEGGVVVAFGSLYSIAEVKRACS